MPLTIFTWDSLYTRSIDRYARIAGIAGIMCLLQYLHVLVLYAAGVLRQDVDSPELQ